MGIPREVEKENLQYKDKSILWYSFPHALISMSKPHFGKSLLCYLLNYLARSYTKTVIIHNGKKIRLDFKHANSLIHFITHMKGIILIEVSQHLI